VGAAVGGGSEAQIDALARFGERYGVAFQHADDLDDGEHTSLAAQAQRRRRELLDEALAALASQFDGDGRTEPLRALARALRGA
jgi:hypothetical protein